MDERAEHDGSPDAPNATQTVETESNGDTDDDDAEESPGPLTRVRSVGTEAVGVVVDAVFDAR